MKHASPQTILTLEEVLAPIRALGVLAERKPGTFYLKGSAFLHFHEDPAGLFADVKLTGKEFTRFAMNTPKEREHLLKTIRAKFAP